MKQKKNKDGMIYVIHKNDLYLLQKDEEGRLAQWEALSEYDKKPHLLSQKLLFRKLDKTAERADVVFTPKEKLDIFLMLREVILSAHEDDKRIRAGEDKQQVYEKKLPSGEIVIASDRLHNYVMGALLVVYSVDDDGASFAKAHRVRDSYNRYYTERRKENRFWQDLYESDRSGQAVDKSNANADGALVSTRRVNFAGGVSKQAYLKAFLNDEERKAHEKGYIYIHDLTARRDTFNCCLFNVGEVMKGGFDMNHVHYNEPKSLQTAFQVIGDVVMAAAGQQYGGFTVAEVEKLLAPYAQRSYDAYMEKYIGLGVPVEKAEETAFADVKRDYAQGFQGWEYKFNTVASSRGDYPFITMSFGLGTGTWEKLGSEMILRTRGGGEGAPGHKKPVLFPKLVFLYDEKLHGEGGALEEVFNVSIECSMKAMYPDYLSLTGEGVEGSVPDMYKRYGAVISPMGCRAFLSPWYERGGTAPADDKDRPVFVGRANIGVVSLNLPMILMEAMQEEGEKAWDVYDMNTREKLFYQHLDVYMRMIRNIHRRTMDYLGEKRASCNPLAFCEGGFYGGHLAPDERIAPLLKSWTASFGITAGEEFQHLWNGKSLIEDGDMFERVMQYINQCKDAWKEEDHILYAVYGTPAESLCGTQVQQFRRVYGDKVKNFTKRSYVSNSFHCHVTSDITQMEKQDYEKRYWNYFNGGKIQYVRYPLDYNMNAAKSLVRRAMRYGFYEGVNLALSYCNQCGHASAELEHEKACPVCGSMDITHIDRMNGYLGYSSTHGGSGDTRFNAAKQEEILERKSM